MVSKKARPAGAAVLRKCAEEIAHETATASPKDIAALSLDEIRLMLHELQVHQIELEMQKEALRTAQADLDTAREHYFNFYNLAPVGFCSISKQGLIIESNLTIASLLGVIQDRADQSAPHPFHPQGRPGPLLPAQQTINQDRSSAELRHPDAKK